MKSLYESILDIDNNIDKANNDIEKTNKIRSIVHNFLDELIDPKAGFEYRIDQEDIFDGKNWAGDRLVTNKIIVVRIVITSYQYNDDYKWFESVFKKHKKDMLSIPKSLGYNKNGGYEFSKANDDLWIRSFTDINEFDFFIRKVQDQITFSLKDVYVDDIKKLIDSKKLKRL